MSQLKKLIDPETQQEYEVANDGGLDNAGGRCVYLRPLPAPAKSLIDEVREELRKMDPSDYLSTEGIATIRVLERRLQALEQRKI